MDAGEAIQCSVFQGKILESHKVLDIGAAVSAAEHPGLLHGADGVGRRHPRNRRHARHLLLGKPHVDYNAPLIHPAVGIGQGQQHIFYLGKGIVEGKLFDMVVSTCILRTKVQTRLSISAASWDTLFTNSSTGIA